MGGQHGEHPTVLNVKEVLATILLHLDETQREAYDCPRSPSITGQSNRPKQGNPGQVLALASSVFLHCIGGLETSLVSIGHL